MHIEGTIMTVQGPMKAAEIGATLSHEHVLVDFVGAETVSRDRYDVDEVIEVVKPHLERVRKLGMKTMVECTPAYIGKDPLLLKRLSEETGIIFLTNTGYYGSRNGVFLPTHAFIETADQLAERWVREWEEGIDGTGIRPGFIKTAVNPEGPLSSMDRKLIEASARTHLQTGLTIVCHTSNGPVFEILEVLAREGVDPAAFVWVHASAEPDRRRHIAAAELGAWVSFDWVSLPVDEYVVLLANMKAAGLLDNVLISHDAGWFDPAKPQGGSADFKEYTIVFEHLVPGLQKQGFSGDEIAQLIEFNPAKAFSVEVRSLPRSR